VMDQRFDALACCLSAWNLAAIAFAAFIDTLWGFCYNSGVDHRSEERGVQWPER
jgi:hypothetical protein